MEWWVLTVKVWTGRTKQFLIFWKTAVEIVRGQCFICVKGVNFETSQVTKGRTGQFQPRKYFISGLIRLVNIEHRRRSQLLSGVIQGTGHYSSNISYVHSTWDLEWALVPIDIQSKEPRWEWWWWNITSLVLEVLNDMRQSSPLWDVRSRSTERSAAWLYTSRFLEVCP